MEIFHLSKNLKSYLKTNGNLEKYLQYLIYHSCMKDNCKIIQKSNDFERKWAKVMNRQFKTEKISIWKIIPVTKPTCNCNDR